MVGEQVNGLLTLAVIFLQLSILAVGGIAPVLPEMQRQVTEVHGYMDRQTFTTLFAMAQAAPGPNMMVSTLMACMWQVSQAPGRHNRLGRAIECPHFRNRAALAPLPGEAMAQCGASWAGSRNSRSRRLQCRFTD